MPPPIPKYGPRRSREEFKRSVLSDEEAAARAYERWAQPPPRRELSVRGLMDDVEGVHKDFVHNPAQFPERLRGRLEGYNPSGGPDINKPAFTYYAAEVTPHRMEWDRNLAREARLQSWPSAITPARNRKKRRVR